MEKLIREMKVGERGYASRLSLRFDVMERAYLVLHATLNKKHSKDYPVRIKKAGPQIDNFLVNVPKFPRIRSYKDKNLLRKLKLNENLVRLEGTTAEKLHVCFLDFIV